VTNGALHLIFYLTIFLVSQAKNECLRNHGPNNFEGYLFCYGEDVVVEVCNVGNENGILVEGLVCQELMKKNGLASW